MRAAVLVVALGAAGCNTLFGFDDILPNADAEASADSGGPGPSVYSSPGPRLHSMNYDFADPVTVTLAADDPAAVIYYTTDGTVPTSGSMHRTTPINGISISATSTLTYFGRTSGDSTPVSEQYFINATKQTSAGYFVSDVTFDGGAPVVVVSPGQVVSGSAVVQTWVQMSCAACGAQVVYGVDTTDQGCLFDSARDDPSGPMLHPGFTRTAMFSVTAPTSPGVHFVLVTHSEQTNCASAMSMSSLLTRPDLSRIGVLIVR